MRLVRVGEEKQAGADPASEWVDIDLDQPGADALLADRVELCEATRALLGETTMNSRRLAVAEGLAMRLCYTSGEGQSLGDASVVCMGLVVTGERLLSVRRGSNREIDELWADIANGTLEVDHGWKAAALLISQIANRAEDQLDELSAALDELEDDVFDGETDLPIEKLGQTRRRLIRDRRNISALSRIIEETTADRSLHMHASTSDELVGAAQTMERHERTAGFYLERANLLHDQIQSQLSDRMNDATLRLGVVATVFLPLGFLTGLLGINVAGIPGTHDPEAFWLVCAILSGLALVASFLIMRLYRS
ncbi:MAG: CorA family divalent cation transporter [Candidatus Binatia bacterium]|nr:CorA family divalent cation transporter [Candidatus Binatia bacterium]